VVVVKSKTDKFVFIFNLDENSLLFAVNSDNCKN